MPQQIWVAARMSPGSASARRQQLWWMHELHPTHTHSHSGTQQCQPVLPVLRSTSTSICITIISTSTSTVVLASTVTALACSLVLGDTTLVVG
jgi:hypothetical protein